MLIQYEAGSDGEPTGIHGSTGAWPPSDEPVEYWEWEEFRRLEHLSGCVSPVLVRDEAAKLMSIGLHHVHADGRVMASFLHDQPVPDGCGFHEYLELEGYTGPEFPPRPIVERP